MITVKAYNFLVHYWEHDEKTLVDLVEDGLIEELQEETLNDGRNFSRVENVRISRIQASENNSHVSKRYVLLGDFFRQSELKWDHVPDSSKKAKSEHGTKEIMPRAKFYLDLLEHTLFWITENGQTH